jgi:hypothetical protein
MCVLHVGVPTVDCMYWAVSCVITRIGASCGFGSSTACCHHRDWRASENLHLPAAGHPPVKLTAARKQHATGTPPHPQRSVCAPRTHRASPARNATHGLRLCPQPCRVVSVAVPVSVSVSVSVSESQRSAPAPSRARTPARSAAPAAPCAHAARAREGASRLSARARARSLAGRSSTTAALCGGAEAAQE